MRLIVVALALFMAPAQADDGLRQIGNDARQAFQSCAFLASSAGMMTRLSGSPASFQKTHDCVRDRVAQISERVRAVTVPAAAENDWREWQVAWRTGMAGLPNVQGGAKPAVDAAIADSLRRIDEAWFRLESRM